MRKGKNSMKKSVKLWIIAAVCIVVAGIVLLVYMNSFQKISPRQVEKIVLFTSSNHSSDVALDADEVNEFVELYNSAGYGGLANGEGGTPELGVTIYFRNGAILHINEFGGHHDFEVFRVHFGIKGRAYYIDSDKLNDFLLALVEKYS